MPFAPFFTSVGVPRIAVKRSDSSLRPAPSATKSTIPSSEALPFGVILKMIRYAAACGVFDRFQVIQRAASLGGVESLCSLPVLTSQWGHTDDQLREAGVTKGMLRLSVGLEDAEDLIGDLDQALG